MHLEIIKFHQNIKCFKKCHPHAVKMYNKTFEHFFFVYFDYKLYIL